MWTDVRTLLHIQGGFTSIAEAELHNKHQKLISTVQCTSGCESFCSVCDAYLHFLSAEHFIVVLCSL